VKERKGEITRESTRDGRERRHRRHRRERERERERERDSIVAFIRNPSVSLSATLMYRIGAEEGMRRTQKTTRKEERRERERERERENRAW